MVTKYKILKDFYVRYNNNSQKSSNIIDSIFQRDAELPLYVRYHYLIKKVKRNNNSTSSISIIHNRCVFTGNSRSVYTHFRLSRMVFKYLAVNGLLPGTSKHSW